MSLKKEISPAAIYSPKNYEEWEHREARYYGGVLCDLGMLAAKAAEIVDPTGLRAIRASESHESQDIE